MNTPEVMGTTADGSLVLGQECCSVSEEPGFAEQRLHLVRHDASGAVVDTLGVYPTGRMGFLSEEIGLLGRPVFEPRARAAIGNDRIAVGLGDRREVRLLSPDGVLRTIVRWTGPSLAVTRSEVEAYRDQVRARYAGRSPSAQRFAEPQVSEDRPVADHFPAHSALLLAETGALWVSRFPRPTWPDDDDLRWLVFGRDGRFLCHARMPAALDNEHRIWEIDGDDVLARVTDEMDVPYVHLYRVEKPGAQRR